MASTMLEPVAAKQLGQLLQEQQEPFILESHLLEKGCLKNNLNSAVSFRCCSGNSSKLLKRSAAGSGGSKSEKLIPYCSKIARHAFNKLISHQINQKMKNSGSGDGNGDYSVTEIGTSNQDVAESDRFSSASSTTVFNSCSDSDGVEDTSSSAPKDQIIWATASANTCEALRLVNPPREQEAATDRKLQWRCMEDHKQLSPLSVDNETEQKNPKTKHIVNSSTSNNIIKHKKDGEDSKFTVSLYKLLVPSSVEMPSCTGIAELGELAGSNPSSPYLKSKMVLQKTKQLLFDCVREVVDAHVWKNRRQQHFRELLGPEELEKLLCKNISEWSKLSGDEINRLTQLLHLDFVASLEEWSDFEMQIREIGIKISETILEDISNEIVTDMS
ncbi:hypothetical protein F0562_035796 [Nyssa sinensis]|uniref:DUF4378 domain-containing protein n=1 Tax=Nyssa sinensis TaxID=561372 RepID=A0A5J5AH19_9ASTE|nr:hypothetical protein F0562_035796 [Nyssa sinensis]